MQEQKGFTLIEVAIAIVVLGFLLGGAVMSLGAQMELRHRNETRTTLETARDALIGHMVAQGRLPCPAPDGATGVEAVNAGNSDCAWPAANVLQLVPATTLGLAPTDQAGYLVDAWGRPIRYRVTRWQEAGFAQPIFTYPGPNPNKLADYVRGNGFPSNSPPPAGFLNVCTDGTNAANCAATRIAQGLVVVLYSTGPNGIDETAIGAPAFHFVNRDAAPGYDDLVLWISPFTLYDRLLAGGTL